MTLDTAAFEFVKGLVHRESAIVLHPGKEYLVQSRLEPIARREGFGSVSELVEAVKGAGDSRLRSGVVDALTTNETSFFRDVAPFEALRTILLPELIERTTTRRCFRIWCAAASTGQEPYSIAMLLDDAFPRLKDWKVEICATDLSRRVLDKAESGIYSQLEVNRGLPARLLLKYFSKADRQWRLNERIRSRVTFTPLNLVGPWPTQPAFDIVFLRNVLIYFDVTTKTKVLDRVRSSMNPGGYLFLGAAETTDKLCDGFRRRSLGACSCYEAD